MFFFSVCSPMATHNTEKGANGGAGVSYAPPTAAPFMNTIL